MPTPEPVVVRASRIAGDGLIAMAGIGLAAVLLASIAAVALWTIHEQSVDAQRNAGERVRSLAVALSPGVESLLASDDLSAVRRATSEISVSQHLSRCRIVLPDGRVVASSTGTDRITAVTLPPAWTEKTPPTELDSTGAATFTQPLHIPGRGVAYLQIAAPTADTGGRRLEAMTAIGGVGAAAMLGVLMIFRRTRQGLRGISAVRQALLTAYGTAGSSPANPISPELGPEAVAWNALVAERDSVRKDALAERAREALGRRKQSRGDLDAACDAMSQGLILIDDQLRVKYANGAAGNFLGLDRERLLGADVMNTMSDEGVRTAIRNIAAGTNRRRIVIDVENKADAPKQGSDAKQETGGVLRFSIRPVRREDSASAMIIIEDITQQRAAEAARHAFVAQATHELRTPLTNIRLYVETAIEDGETDPAIRTQALNVINGEARRLERIVGEMLSVAEIEAGQFKLRVDDIRLDQLFDEVKRDYAEQAREKRITLTFLLPPKLPVMSGDRDKVTVALHNLVGNALKYTPDGGGVTVRVEADEKQLAVAVADTGIGIAAEDCERIFERFYRANDRRVAKISGTGLGLPIAREVARLHGGDIKVDSQIDRGSTFTLTLPVKPAA